MAISKVCVGKRSDINFINNPSPSYRIVFREFKIIYKWAPFDLQLRHHFFIHSASLTSIQGAYKMQITIEKT